MRVKLLVASPGGLSRSWLLDELKALSIFHGRPILDRLNVLLVVERDSGGVQVQEVTELVADVGSEAVVSAVVDPNLN